MGEKRMDSLEGTCRDETCEERKVINGQICKNGRRGRDKAK